jgi:hypothetical protein
LAGGINPYAYVLNNPVNAIDPYGLDGGVISGPAAVYGAIAAGGAATLWWATHKDQMARDLRSFWDWLWNENTEDGTDDNTDCPTNDEGLSDDIAEHAQKHNPRIPTDELSELIKDTIRRGEKKDLDRGRRAYYDPLTVRVVVVDPSSPDKGTSLMPDRGRDWFDDLE